MHTPQDIDDAREYDTRMQRNRNPIASEVIVTQYKRRRRSAQCSALTVEHANYATIVCKTSARRNAHG